MKSQFLFFCYTFLQVKILSVFICTLFCHKVPKGKQGGTPLFIPDFAAQARKFAKIVGFGKLRNSPMMLCSAFGRVEFATHGLKTTVPFISYTPPSAFLNYRNSLYRKTGIVNLTIPVLLYLLHFLQYFPLV